MSRRFRLSRPTTWPRWFWYPLVTLWCVLISAVSAWINYAVGLYPFWQAAGYTFVTAMVWNVSYLAWHDYKRRRTAQ